MVYWRAIVGVGLVLALAGCGGEAGPSGFDAGGEAPIGGTTTEGGGAHDEDEGGLPPTSTTTYGDTTTWGGDGSTGGVEDTLFGMSDDMPLVADIPDIKRGEVGEGTWVVIEQVRPTTGRASLGRDAWFYVQDPVAQQHMGLRVLLRPGDAMPAADRWVDLQGWVRTDEQGWLLELEEAIEGGRQSPVLARRVRVGKLVSSEAVFLDDALVDVVEPLPLVVTGPGPVPGTLIAGVAALGGGSVLVDLRPFDLEGVQLPVGIHLSSVRGVAELGGSRPVILPRSAGDIVVAP